MNSNFPKQSNIFRDARLNQGSRSLLNNTIRRNIMMTWTPLIQRKARLINLETSWQRWMEGWKILRNTAFVENSLNKSIDIMFMNLFKEFSYYFILSSINYLNNNKILKKIIFFCWNNSIINQPIRDF